MDNIHVDDHPEGDKTPKLEEIPRIKMLLAMLRWDVIPDEQATRYMKIEPDNEYQERRVLPVPLQILKITDNRRFPTEQIVSSTPTKQTEKPKPKKNINKPSVIISERQVEVAEVSQSQKFAIEQVLDATVLSIKGNKVTYEILGTIKLTEKEPKKATYLKPGQFVKVKITGLKEDESIKSVKHVD